MAEVTSHCDSKLSWPIFGPLRGHPFMTSTKSRIFDPLPLSTCVYMSQTPSPLWTSTLLIDIAEKISLFIPSKDEIPTSLHEKKTGWWMSVDSNFNFLCGRPHVAWPPSPVYMRPPEPDPPTLRVDVINGWPPTKLYLTLYFLKKHHAS